MKQFYIYTLGCKVNQFESDGIATGLVSRGWRQVFNAVQAQVLIVNTCAVTSKAGMQSRQAIRKIIRENRSAKVLVTGCHAQTASEQIKNIDHVDHVICNTDKNKIAEHILDLCESDFSFTFKAADHTANNRFLDFKETVSGQMTRAYLKIQDGCNAFCTYCIVPYARGSSVSMKEDSVFSQLAQLSAKGFKEVILTGIHIGMYGLDLKPAMSLESLLKKIDRKKPVHRIRLSSIEPGELTEAVIQLASQDHILCDHFHIPVQSGDNGILKKMKRPYNSGQVEKLIEQIHKHLPNAGIGVDTLIGFPEESHKAFDHTYQLIEKLPISHLHVFPFSARQGTPAWHFEPKIESHVIKERCAQIRALGKEKQAQFIKSQSGRTLEALVQSQTDTQTGMLKAITSNYLTVLVENKDEYKGKILDLNCETQDGSMNLFGNIIA